MAAISGTFNMCDPERVAARRTTCGGSRCSPRPAAGSIRGSSRSAPARSTRTTCGNGIPDNVRKSTWERLVQIDERGGQDRRSPRGDAGLRAGDQQRRQLGRARRGRLLDEIGSPWLKVVIDPANLLRPGERAPDGTRSSTRRSTGSARISSWRTPRTHAGHRREPPDDRGMAQFEIVARDRHRPVRPDVLEASPGEDVH